MDSVQRTGDASSDPKGSEGAEEELLERLRTTEALIGYEPMSDEPDFSGFLSAHVSPVPIQNIPPTSEKEPEQTAKELHDSHQESSVALLIPGRAFDAVGTRHGRGRGWYDRLLANLPENWLRIGVTNPAHFSEKPLIRQSWDQPVDFILIENRGVFEVIKTRARDVI